MLVFGDPCNTTARKTLATPDINNDGFNDLIYQNICDGKPGYIDTALTNPQKPDQLIRLSQWCMGTWPCLHDGLRRYSYSSDRYSLENGNSNFVNDSIRVIAFGSAGATAFGLYDTVSYTQECQWYEHPQAITQKTPGDMRPMCLATGKIREFAFMVDEAAARLVSSGVYVNGSDTFIPISQLTLVKSADPMRLEVRDAARTLVDSLQKTMEKSLSRHTEILGYAPREQLYSATQDELKRIEVSVTDMLKKQLNGSEYLLWTAEARLYAFNMAVNQLNFPPQDY